MFHGRSVFLKRPKETEQLIIHRVDINVPLTEGDIVKIIDHGETFKIVVLKDETIEKKAQIENLIDDLKNQK